MTSKLFLFIFSIIFDVLVIDINAQTIVQDLETYKKTYEDSSIITETIKSLSYTGKTLIITNTAQILSVGDFITMSVDETPIAKAIVAKHFIEKNLSGLKLVTIYDFNYWKQVDKGFKINITRGDDSYLLKKKDNSKNEELKDDSGEKILSEEDLFDTSDIDSKNLEENAKRVIKNDNLVGGCYGFISLVDKSSKKKSYDQLCAHWSYQVIDNIWGEIYFGQTKIKDFPADGLDTIARSITTRIKYTFQLATMFVAQPYLGFQYLSANSPGAGKSSNGIVVSTEDSKRELALLKSVEKRPIVLGFTLFIRSVPGWFFKFDIGTDILNGGIVVEF